VGGNSGVRVVGAMDGCDKCGYRKRGAHSLRAGTPVWVYKEWVRKAPLYHWRTSEVRACGLRAAVSVDGRRAPPRSLLYLSVGVGSASERSAPPGATS